MSVKIQHVVPSQRRHYRVTVPITISMDGKEYTALNWSIGGFKIGGMKENIKLGDVRHVYVSIPFHGFDIGFITKARIMRCDRAAEEMAAEFIDLGERGLETLGTFVHGLISGEMAEIDGVIRRLDLPVTPATLAPPDDTRFLSPDLIEQKRRKGMRLYAIAGKLLAAVLLVVLYTNIFEMKIDTSFVTGRNDVLLAPAAGTVSYMAATGKPVKAGAPLVTVSDPELQNDITTADYKVRDADVEVRRLNAMADLEKKRLSAADKILSDVSSNASDTVKTLEKNLAVKQNSLRMYQDLYKQGYASRILVDKAEADALDIQRQLNAARQEAAMRQQQYSTVKTGFQVRDGAVEDGVQDAETMRQAADERLANARAELASMQQREGQLTLRAPAGGKLVRSFIPDHSAAKYGDPIAVFERGGTRVVQAFLTQQEALNVRPGQSARLYLPAHWWSIPVTVKDVDYYSLTLNQSSGALQWQNTQNDQFKTVLVTLAPAGARAMKDMQQIAPGTASTVLFTLL